MTESVANILSTDKNQKKDLAEANIRARECFERLEDIAEDFPIEEENRRVFKQALDMVKEGYFNLLNSKNK